MNVNHIEFRYRLLLFWLMSIYDLNSIHYAHDFISVISIFILTHFIAFPSLLFLSKRKRSRTWNEFQLKFDSRLNTKQNSTLSSQMMVVVTRVWCCVELTILSNHLYNDEQPLSCTTDDIIQIQLRISNDWNASKRNHKYACTHTDKHQHHMIENENIIYK